MTYLELDGYLQGGTPYYSTYRFQPLRSSQDILGQFSGERREFLAGMLRHAKKAKTWFSIDVDQTAAALGVPRDRIVRALDYLGEQGFIELQVAGTRNQYQRLKSPADHAALAADLHGRMVAREEREIARVHQMLELLHLDRCQVSALCAHFGESLAEPCGHCSWCLEKDARSSKPKLSTADRRAKTTLDAKIVAKAMDLRRQHPEALRDATQLARLLCGVSSPALSKAKLSSHPLSGSLADVSFHVVRDHFARA
jgi:ATP-dependent DNA helicase RecQ